MDFNSKQLIDSNEVASFSLTDLSRNDDWFTRFTVDNFLPKELDERLRRSFPDWIITSLSDEVFSTTISYDDPQVAHVLDASPDWQTYFSRVTSEQFLRQLIHLFRGEILSRYPWHWRWILGRRALNPDKLHLTALFSVSRRGFHLSPHSDDRYKVVSLIHYLPEIGSAGWPSGGTRFFVPRDPRANQRIMKPLSNWSRGVRRFIPFILAPSFELSLSRRLRADQMVDASEFAQFGRHFTETVSPSYSPNRLAGFIKNAWSVHEVDLTDFPANELRRAIIINVRLKPTQLTGFLDNLDVRLSEIKRTIRDRTR